MCGSLISWNWLEARRVWKKRQWHWKQVVSNHDRSFIGMEKDADLCVSPTNAVHRPVSTLPSDVLLSPAFTYDWVGSHGFKRKACWGNSSFAAPLGDSTCFLVGVAKGYCICHWSTQQLKFCESQDVESLICFGEEDQHPFFVLGITSNLESVMTKHNTFLLSLLSQCIREQTSSAYWLFSITVAVMTTIMNT